MKIAVVRFLCNKIDLCLWHLLHKKSGILRRDQIEEIISPDILILPSPDGT